MGTLRRKVREERRAKLQWFREEVYSILGFHPDTSEEVIFDDILALRHYRRNDFGGTTREEAKKDMEGDYSQRGASSAGGGCHASVYPAGPVLALPVEGGQARPGGPGAEDHPTRRVPTARPQRGDPVRQLDIGQSDAPDAENQFREKLRAVLMSRINAVR